MKLRELVSYFGSRGWSGVKGKTSGPFFSGVSVVLNLSEFSIGFNTPTSTSKTIEVAWRFAGSGGMVITVGNDKGYSKGQLCEMKLVLFLIVRHHLTLRVLHWHSEPQFVEVVDHKVDGIDAVDSRVIFHLFCSDHITSAVSIMAGHGTAFIGRATLKLEAVSDVLNGMRVGVVEHEMDIIRQYHVFGVDFVAKRNKLSASIKTILSVDQLIQHILVVI